MLSLIRLDHFIRLFFNRRDQEAYKEGSSGPKQGSDGEEIGKLLQLIVGVQHSTIQEGDNLHYLCDKVLGRTFHGQTVEFSTILEVSKQCAKLYVSGSDKVEGVESRGCRVLTVDWVEQRLRSVWVLQCNAAFDNHHFFTVLFKKKF